MPKSRRRSSKADALIHRLSAENDVDFDVLVDTLKETPQQDFKTGGGGIKIQSTLSFLICLCAMQFVVELPVFLPSAFLIDYSDKFQIDDSVIGMCYL